jgi:hypothetical protein
MTICACRYPQRSMPFPGQRRPERRGGLAHRDGLSVARPSALMPGPGLDDVSEPPEPGFARVWTRTNTGPAFTRRQFDDAVNVRGIDKVGFARDAVDELAVPTTAWIQVEHLFDIAAIEDLGIETPGVIMRCGVRLFHLEPVQRASVIQMVFNERPRHALDADDTRAFRNARNGRSR